jgi:hypothetical protein
MERRRSIQDEPEVTRQEELAFLRKLNEDALKSLMRLRRRSGSSSSLLSRSKTDGHQAGRIV